MHRSNSGALAVGAQEWEWPGGARAAVRLVGARDALVLLVGVVLRSECDAPTQDLLADGADLAARLVWSSALSTVVP
eukprot:1518460-Prymnesium_polylepis.1